MKTGKPPRLSEKLNSDLDVIRQEHTALMNSQLENFRIDFSGIATSALNTIETDIRYFLNDSRSELQRRSETIRRRLTISPWVIAGLIMAWIASTMVVSWLWIVLLTRLEMTELGLTRIEQAGQIWLTLDPEQAVLKTCTIAGMPIICIEIKGQ
ncbi:hypothetical protein [Ruegeria sp.]|uniref:hypothetical protein n=1 Tax=Ruegeria sp. TaxID=1879320 RepID=UPI00231CF659|nr:hypothetical protein [Ruegeria sp.]MDA7966399.1 hypothetical protein [Ruegeria sp.]